MDQRNSARRAVLALMGLYYPFLAVSCVIAAALALAFIAPGARMPRFIGVFVMLPGIFFGMTVVHVLFSLRALAHRPSLDDPMEVELAKKWVPGLYALMRDVAGELKLPAADEIRLHANEVAYVREEEGGLKVLGIGGVALASFTEEELAGIIAHELGHLAGGETRLARRARWWTQVMAQLEFQFAGSRWAWLNPLVWLIRGYHFLFQRCWAAASRAEEFAADRHTAELVGERTAARALVLIYSVDELPWSQLYNMAETCVALKVPMQDIFSEQARRARQTGPDDWVRACTRALKRKTAPFDSHPSLKDRLRALGMTRSRTLKLARRLNASGPPAAELIEDFARIEKVLTSRIIQLVREAYEAKMDFAQIVLGGPVT